MPRDFSGNYTLPLGNPVNTDTIIDVNWANPLMADIAVQLNNLLTRDGRLGALAPIYFASGSAAAPGISFTADPALGFFRVSAGILGASVGGTEVARWTSTGYAMSGVPTAPTAAVDTSTTQLATTAYVVGQGYLKSAAAAAAYAPLGGAGASGTWGINVTGSASVLQTARNINGVSFNGSADITVPAAAGTLTGATLAAGVTASSLTSIAAAATVGGIEIGFRRLVAASVTTGAFAAADSSKCVYATAGVTIPNSTMAANDTVIVQNTTGSAITITKLITTAYNTGSGAALGATFTLAARGRMSIVFTSSTECYVSGNIS